MSRPNLTPWYSYGDGWQRTQREPYLDAEVMAAADGGWMWRVSTIEGQVIRSGWHALSELARVSCDAVLNQSRSA